MISPRRRATRKEYLDASVVPVEAALLARADAVEMEAFTTKNLVTSEAKKLVATEFRALAEELHWH